MNSLWIDIRRGVRLLAGNSLLTATMATSLALGIGVNSAVFSYLDAFFLRPLPAVEEPERVLSLYSQPTKSTGLLPVSYLNYLDIAAWSETFSSLAAHQTIWIGMAGKGEPEQVVGEMVSADYFKVLGVAPALGRTFTADEAALSGNEAVVVLSHGLWKRRFAADPRVVGQRISLNGRPFSVIGVAARGFTGPSSFSPAQLWVPLGVYQTVFIAPELLEVRSAQVLQVVGRLKPEVSPATAQAEMVRLAFLLEQEYPADNRESTLLAIPLSQANLPPGIRALWLKAGAFLTAIVGILLLAACTNVAILLLVRSATRGKEFALRLSLGASRFALLRQLLVEGLLLALLGGICSLGVTLVIWNLLIKLRPPYFAPGALDMQLDVRVLGFVLVLSLVTGVLFGLAPMLSTLRVDLASDLKVSSGLVESRQRKLSTRHLLLVGQVALGAVTVACAGLFLQSLAKAQRVEPGFETERLLTVSFDLQSQGYNEAHGRAFQERLLASVQHLAGVESASLGENRPLGGFRFFRNVSRLGREAYAQEDARMVGSSIVDAGYFATLGIPIVRGRAFGPGDRPGAPPVAIVNETLRKLLWPEDFSPGTLLWLDDEQLPVEVVGVTQDVKYINLEESPRPVLYLPLDQRYSDRATLHIRTSTPPERLAGLVRREVRSLEASLPLIDLETASDTVRRSLWAPRMNAALLSVLSGVVLSLAAVGVYGVAASTMAPRRREIAIRMALGAQRRLLVGGFVRSGGTLVMIGVVTGLAVAQVVGRWLASFIQGVDQESWTVFATTAAVLLAVGLLAHVLPALRATRVDPAESLHVS